MIPTFLGSDICHLNLCPCLQRNISRLLVMAVVKRPPTDNEISRAEGRHIGMLVVRQDTLNIARSYRMGLYNKCQVKDKVVKEEEKRVKKAEVFLKI